HSCRYFIFCCWYSYRSYSLSIEGENKMTFTHIIFGLIVGFLFGYILSRTGVTRYSRVMGMLLLKDFKILKFMLTAVTSSMILFYLIGDIGLLKVVPKNLDWGKVVGGLIFGTGMGIL